jgi:regulatory protein
VSAYTDAVRLLSRRQLSVTECRSRLAELEHSDVDIETAITHLLETGALDDARFARAYARTASDVKGRGRLRVIRELEARGVDHDTAAEAVGETYGDKDERSLVTRALQKKLRGRPAPKDRREYARLYQHLMRQGFTPAAVHAALRKLRGPEDDDELQ